MARDEYADNLDNQTAARNCAARITREHCIAFPLRKPEADAALC